ASRQWRQYALAQLPRLLREAEQWSGLEKLLCDLSFVEAKAAAELRNELLLDYDQALEQWPRDDEEEQWGDRLRQYVDRLILHSSNPENVLLPDPLPVGMQNDLHSCRLARQCQSVENLRAFRNFIAGYLNWLGKRESPIWQLAWNSADRGPVVERALAAQPSPGQSNCVWFKRLNRPPYIRYPALILTLRGHSDKVTSVSMTADARLAVSASEDRTIRVWDLKAGKCLRTFQGHSDKVHSVSVTPDGRRAVSGSEDHTLRVWDLENGQCLYTLHANNA